ncbi:hypothetical protein [Mycolicibacterium neoaurum]|uniref:hypothetical protein n=1 Tax=Mycolicibacterium neoaurum TaxID=1795 RepID=UPI001F4D0AE6|nr:hypothetical protein [Mycolicibacterium neoaurum]
MNSAIRELDRAVAELKRSIIAAWPEARSALAYVALGYLVAIVALLIDGALTWGELVGGGR